MKDPVIAAVRTDFEKENGMLPIGRLVHIVTVTYAYRGILQDVTPSHYILSDAFEVYETGPLAEYGKNKHGKSEDPLFGETRIERGACVRISIW